MHVLSDNMGLQLGGETWGCLGLFLGHQKELVGQGTAFVRPVEDMHECMN